MKLKQSLHWTLFSLIAFALTASLSSPSARAADPEQSKSGWISDGKLDLNFRYRYEFVDQDGFTKDAHASTLRTRLAYRSPYFSNFGFLIEFDDVRSIGDDLYNSTRNGNTNRPVVADPEGIEVNQALILYRGIENTVIRTGRRRITLDNHRFIGDVGWRQNDQTYDSFSLSNTSLPKTTIEYAYIDNVKRVFGPDSGTPAADFQSDSHILNVKHEWLPNWDVTAYAYLLDLEDSPSLSNKTFGIRINGSNVVNDRTSTSYTVEYAHQENYGDNPNNYSADYILLEGALTIAGITGKLGYELLEGDSVQAFQTPLATLHAFQGWADKFLATPSDGIEDLYFSIATKIRGTNISLIYHRINPEAGGPDYGSEWDLLIRKPIADRYSLVFKYADYDARSFSTDTEKLWIMITAKFGN
jgi:hypothetical protein